MISHDVGAAIKYANKILHVAGNVFFGSTDEYLQSAAGKRFLAVSEEKDD